MRLSFVSGKQKELIQNFKNKQDLTWKQLANLLEIKGGRLKAYVEETSLISEDIYQKLDKEKQYEKFIFNKKNKNWGQIKGGKSSAGNTKKIILPHDSEKLAEFYGIMLGDGNSHRTNYYKSRNNKRGVYMIRVVGDSRLDKDYLVNYVKPLVEGLFNLKVNIHFFKNKNAIYIESYSKELVSFLEGKGFIPGNKIKNKLKIPDWIKSNPSFLIECIRGLYDTDGSVYKLTNQNSYQFSFTSYNLPLLRDIRESLLRLDINCSKISKGKEIYITKKSELRKFLKLVGFHNHRHLNKIRMWNI